LVSLKDVAEYTGLSVSTVSRAVINKGYVKKETRSKVLEAVRILGYRPNVIAQSLKNGRTRTLALIIPSIQNMVYPDITRGVEDTARKNGFSVILCNTDENIEAEKAYINILRPHLIDGFIIASMMASSTHILQLRAEQFPVVLALRSCSEEIDSVVIDNKQAAYNGTRYLIERGHRRIALALGNTGVSLYAERYAGYRAALEDGGLPYDEALVMREREGGVASFYDLTKGLLERGMPDAIFATNDARAIVIMRVLYDAGLSIPGDVSVMGFDNVEIAALFEPPLSTIAQPLYDIGVLSAQRLIFQIEYKEKHGVLDAPQINTIDTNLLIRKSTR